VDHLRFLMEDILRLAKEKENPTIDDIMEDSKVGEREVKEAIKELGNRKLVKFKDGKISLTDRGEEVAGVIYNYHKTIEKIFGHRVAHSVEHLGKDYIEKAKILGKNAVPLEEFSEGERGVVALLEIEDSRVLSRLVGIGVTIGTEFSVVKFRKDGILLDIDGKVVIIDRKLGKLIFAVKKNEGSYSGTA
jgi:Fe2+ transport system protein FeoA